MFILDKFSIDLKWTSQLFFKQTYVSPVANLISNQNIDIFFYILHYFTGLPNSINEAGFAYYDNLIDELWKYKIMPMVTLYHFDLPQYLQDLGGWLNPLSHQWFEDYSAEVFKRFAHKVPFWITINQVIVF